MTSKASAPPILVAGWQIFAHPLFLDQVEVLIAAVADQKRRDPERFRSRAVTKRLAAILTLVTEVIPRDPADAMFRLGNALGPAHRHWCRAKFFQQYRLFFRFDTARRVIVLAWVNDDRTLRAYESDQDAYAVFARMLARGHPPTSFDALLDAATATAGRLTTLLAASKDI
jgi:toxin YhaV